MTVTYFFSMICIAVLSALLVNFKGFTENINYIRTRLYKDKEHTGTWTEQYFADCASLGLTHSGFELRMTSHFGYIDGYFSSYEKSAILCEGRWIWWKRKFTKFYTLTFRDGRRLNTGEFTVQVKDGFLLVINGFLEHEDTIVLAKVSDDSNYGNEKTA